MRRIAGLTKIVTDDPALNRVQDHLLAVLNPVLQAVSGVAYHDNEPLIGTITGTTGTDGNAIFYLKNTPNPVGSLVLVKTQTVMRVELVGGSIVGFNAQLVGNKVTFFAPNIPATGNDWLAAWYRS